MKMIRALLSFLAMITFIPLRTIQHFDPLIELDQCLLADICNHTWIPECGFYEKRVHTRLFIDECDMYEYNCDFDMLYKFTNYSECFGAATCPSVPDLLTRVQGFYIYYADGRRMLYHPPAGRSQTKFTLPFPTAETTDTTRSTNYHQRRRYTPRKTKKFRPWTEPPCAPCGRMTTKTPHETRKTLSQYWPPLQIPTGMHFPWATIITNKQTKKRTTESTTKRTIKRTRKRTTKPKPTTQIIRTATIGTVILKKATVWKNGKLVHKVVKGYKKHSVITKTEDSDFLE